MKETLLIVDDDIDSLRLLGLILERQNYTVVTANNGDEAIRKARNEKPDLILMDVTMPGRDGYEVTKIIKEDQKMKNIPIIMLTAKGDLDDKVVGFESGVDDYLTKPTQPKELIAHIQAVLTRNIKNREIKEVTSSLPRSYTIGVIAAKGGLGCSTLSLALGLLLKENSEQEVIVAEYRPGQGTLGFLLGVEDPMRIPNLFDIPLSELNLEHIVKCLINYTLPKKLHIIEEEKRKIKILLSSSNPGESKYIQQTELYRLITHLLTKISGFLVLDLGTSLNPIAEKTIEQCDELIVITDTVTHTVQQTRALLLSLRSYGFNGNKIDVFLHKTCYSSMCADSEKPKLDKEDAYTTLFTPKSFSIKDIKEQLNLPIYYNEGGFTRYWEVMQSLAENIANRNTNTASLG